MSNEPPKNADELLKAYARQRQADGGDPLELHPATRRMLQGEVARTLAAGPRRHPVEAQRLAPLWRRYLYVGLTALAVLVAGIYAVKIWVAPVSNGPEQLALLQKQSFPVAEMREELPRQSSAFVKSGVKITEGVERNDPAKPAMGDTTLAIVDGLAPTGERKSALDLNGSVTMSGSGAVAFKSVSSLGDDRKAETVKHESVKLAYDAPVPVEKQLSVGGAVVPSGEKLGIVPAASPANPVGNVSEPGVAGSGSTVTVALGTISGTSGTGALTRAAAFKETSADADKSRTTAERDMTDKGLSLRSDELAAAAKSKTAVAEPARGISINGGTLVRAAGPESPSATNTLQLSANNTFSGGMKLDGVTLTTAPTPSSSVALATVATTAASPAVMSPVPAAPPQPAAPLVLDAERALAADRAATTTQTWNFVETKDRSRLRRNFNSPPPVNVLNSFQFENTGSTVRVIDADGSVYTGSIAIDQSPAAGGVGGGGNEFATKAEAASGTQQIHFRVTGTSRSLNQPVVFEGSLALPSPSGPPRDAFQVTHGSAVTNAQLKGWVRVGTRTQLEINAVPAAR